LPHGMNVSDLPESETARTDPECAAQRAEHLAIIGIETVIELCVGPSLRTMEEAYGRHGIRVTGNDIDPRWREHHPRGDWIMGDALLIDPRPYDVVVFAPPLSRGCSGTRKDALPVDEVRPRYVEFLLQLMGWGYHGVGVLVLPARSLSTRTDREETHRLLSNIPSHEAVPLVAGPRRIRKYVDVYFDV
jgi:hypothetical protein